MKSKSIKNNKNQEGGLLANGSRLSILSLSLSLSLALLFSFSLLCYSFVAFAIVTLSIFQHCLFLRLLLSVSSFVHLSFPSLDGRHAATSGRGADAIGDQAAVGVAVAAAAVRAAAFCRRLFRLPQLHGPHCQPVEGGVKR